MLAHNPGQGGGMTEVPDDHWPVSQIDSFIFTRGLFSEIKIEGNQGKTVSISL